MTTPLHSLTPEARFEITQWLAVHLSEIPEAVRSALRTHERLVDALAKGANDLTRLLKLLRQEMGIEPKSERQPKKRKPRTLAPKPRQRKDPVERLRERKARVEARRSAARAQLRRQERELAAITVQIERSRAKNDPTSPATQSEVIEQMEPPMTEEEEQRQLSEECEAQRQRSELRGEIDPSLRTAREALMQGRAVTMTHTERKLKVAPDRVEGAKVLHVGSVDRVRYDFSLAVHRVELEVEKKVIVTAEGERKTVYASTKEVGPPRFSVTWQYLVNLTLMTTMYAVPMHRVARMLASDEHKCTASSLSKMQTYVARRFVSIYLRLFDELSDAEIMMGDDTNCRVLESNRHFAEANDHEGAPWSNWPQRNAKVDPEEASSKTVGPRLARELGFVFPCRNGKREKISINTTVLAGRSQADDPTSFIVFYRTHFGSLGNLIEVALERRSPALQELIVQCDLSTTNLVADPELLTRFRIVIAGCLYHARRPFARYKHEDPDLCRIMLSCFAGLSFLEEDLDLQGRNYENVQAVRQIDGKELWATIKNAAKVVKMKWSNSTKLGEAASYILRHEKELEYYLSDPRLAPDNNLSERMVRMERIIENNSMFRVSFEGRCGLDIMRTITQTAIAAEAPVAEYLDDILRTPHSEIEGNPERFTPHAWMKRKRARDEERELDQDLSSEPA